MRLEDHIQVAWRDTSRMAALRKSAEQLSTECFSTAQAIRVEALANRGLDESDAEQIDPRGWNKAWGEASKRRFTCEARPASQPHAVFVCGVDETSQRLAGLCASRWCEDRGGAVLLCEGLISCMHPAPETLPMQPDHRSLQQASRRLLSLLLVDAASHRLSIVVCLSQDARDACLGQIAAMEDAGYHVSLVSVGNHQGVDAPRSLRAAEGNRSPRNIRIIRIPESILTSNDQLETKDKRSAPSRRIQINTQQETNKSLKRERDSGSRATPEKPAVPTGQTVASIPPPLMDREPTPTSKTAPTEMAGPAGPKPVAKASQPERVSITPLDEGTKRRRQMQMLIRKKADTV